MPSADVKKLEKALPDLLETDPEFLERSEPQSPQSVFRLHCEYSEPGPPSSPAFEGTRAVMHALNPGLQHSRFGPHNWYRLRHWRSCRYSCSQRWTREEEVMDSGEEDCFVRSPQRGQEETPQWRENDTGWAALRRRLYLIKIKMRKRRRGYIEAAPPVLQHRQMPDLLASPF